MRRIVDLSVEPVSMHIELDHLVIDFEDRAPARVMLDELAVLIVANRNVRLSQSVLSRLAGVGAMYLACDDRFMPVGMMLPLQGNFLQAERMARQVEASLPTKKRLWKQLVVAKILSQGAVLERVRGNDGDFPLLARQVRSGDPANVEARAARSYWPALFDDPEFRRDRAAEDANRLLNYGYAVLRAIVARAICAAGLHPSIGLHHHNRYNAFVLADDIIEAFRAAVDLVVHRIVSDRGHDTPLDKVTKSELIGALLRDFEVDGEARSLFDVVARVATSLVQVFEGEAELLDLPTPEAVLAAVEDAESGTE